MLRAGLLEQDLACMNLAHPRGDTSVMWLQHNTLVVFGSTLSSLVPSAGLCALPFNNSLWYLLPLSPPPSVCPPVCPRAADAVSSNMLPFPPPPCRPFVPTHQYSDPANDTVYLQAPSQVVMQAEGAGRDVLLLDIALDNYFRLCIERTDKSSLSGDDLLEMVGLVLSNACIAGESQDFGQVRQTDFCVILCPALTVYVYRKTAGVMMMMNGIMALTNLFLCVLTCNLDDA